MSKKIIYATIFLFLIGYTGKSQDTITVLQYNLLNYGLPVYGCDNSNNNPDEKDENLRIILSEIHPDIFTVNELRYESYDTTIADRLLSQVLNVDSDINYDRAHLTNMAGSHIVNMLYFNTGKLGLIAQGVITAYRDINVYKLYYRSKDLEARPDTTFLYCIVVHLKSSQGADNEAIRADMTNMIMNYVGANNIENVLLMGDFNVYTDQEEAFQNLVNHSNENIRFYDPLNKMGSWHNNADYADIHTQSTHSLYNDCASSGGMDDRFDFILMDKDIKNNTTHIGYIASTYKAIGNDGTCFNQSLTECENVDLSSEMIQALYNMSDHLPVTLKLITDLQPQSTLEKQADKLNRFTMVNPVNNNLIFMVQSGDRNTFGLSLFSLYGEKVKSFIATNAENRFDVSDLEEGVYILKVVDAENNISARKIMIKH